MRKDFLRAKINFYISVIFLGSFTLFMMVTVFRMAQLDNPIEDMLTATIPNSTN
jgi:hypothetical protein